MSFVIVALLAFVAVTLILLGFATFFTICDYRNRERPGFPIELAKDQKDRP